MTHSFFNVSNILSRPFTKSLSYGLFIVCSLSGATAYSQEFDFRPLSEARSSLKPTPYTPAQRKLVAEQALMFIKNMYVHRELKVKDFGAKVDPVPRLEAIVAEASSLSDSEFHEKIQSVFVDLHDNHTGYTAPLPLRCSYVVSPLSFRDADENGKKVVLFDQVSRIFESIPGEHTNAKRLDKLLAVDGVDIDTYLKNVIHPESSGANDDAMTVYGLMNFTIRSLASLPVPKKDTITYTLQGADGKYEIKSDLYALVNEPSCAKSAANEQASGAAVDAAENTTVKIWKEYVAPATHARFADDILSEIANIQDIKTPAGPITFMQLHTFMPQNSSVESLIHRVRDELKKRHDTSRGLVIDLRNNGGGAVKLAEEMIQLFTPNEVQPSTVRLLPNKLNLEMFLRSNGREENGWTSDIRAALARNEKYTAPRILTTVREANRSGQVWMKPVILIVNAACYSACDMFAAGMQDHGAATIVGSHTSTGAGGANVMEYAAFKSVFGAAAGLDNPFKTLPGAQSMRVSWRQSVRVGKNAGKLIEDAGVKPDFLVRESRADIERGESFAIMKKIKEILEVLEPRFASNIKLASSVRIENGDGAKWSEQVSGVDKVEVRLDGKILKTFDINSDKEILEIEIADVSGEWENKRFTVIGYKENKVAVRIVRELFWRGKSIPMPSSGLRETFDGPLTYLKTNVSLGPSESVWQPVDGVLRVGQGPNYSSSVVTEALFPVDATSIRGDLAVVIDFDLQSEEGMDVFSIMARDPNTGAEQYIYTLDGTISTGRPAMIPIPKIANQMEIVLEFESDENWNMVGPKIKTLAVIKAPNQSPFEGGLFSNLVRRIFPRR
ncbi:MAG: S41 family peptidase [Proteobacteria bacterium]|nr:S41 family peptidase [Pseudomonadota bacterium]